MKYFWIKTKEGGNLALWFLKLSKRSSFCVVSLNNHCSDKSIWIWVCETKIIEKQLFLIATEAKRNQNHSNWFFHVCIFFSFFFFLRFSKFSMWLFQIVCFIKQNRIHSPKLLERTELKKKPSLVMMMMMIFSFHLTIFLERFSNNCYRCLCDTPYQKFFSIFLFSIIIIASMLRYMEQFDFSSYSS